MPFALLLRYLQKTVAQIELPGGVILCVNEKTNHSRQGRGDKEKKAPLSPLLGIHNNTAYYLLYNGIPGDRRPQGGNVLTSAILAYLDETFPHDGPRIIYGETTRLGAARLALHQPIVIVDEQLRYVV